MSTTLAPAARMAGACCALTLWGKPSSATSQPCAASAGGHIFESQVGAPGQRQVHRAQRLADVIDRDHTRELDLRDG